MEDEWKNFTVLVERVKKLTKPLQEDTGEVEEILKEYEKLLIDEGATPKECDELSQLSQSLTKVMDDLKNVREKETSKDIVIQFVGATNAGKSSVINALLGERRLPVGFMQTTMCSIRVCITEDSEWSIEKIDENGNKELLTEGIDDKTVRDLLSKMSGQKNEQLRKTKGIDLRTIIQVNWPASKCKKLPRNVVLGDTPGFGENNEDMELVTQTCKKADIIVAVMDSMSPSRGRLTDLVKNVGCQFTFGVFTKWDECIRKAKEEGEQCVRDVEKMALDYIKEFCEALQGKGKAYSVNVKNFENPDEIFHKFEHKLATSATKLKVESLTQQAKSVALHSREVCAKLTNVLETRKEKKIHCLKKEKDSISKAIKTLEKVFESIKNEGGDLEIFTDDAVQRLLKKVEDELLEGISEGEAVKHFLDKINEKIQNTMVLKTDVTGNAFQEWKKNIQLHKFQSLDMPRSQAPPKLTDQELPKDQYQWYCDFNYYYTNNYICATVAGVLAAVTPFVTGAGIGALVAARAGEAIVSATMTGGAWAIVVSPFGAFGGYARECYRSLRLGDYLKRKFPISQYKVSCWKNFLNGQLRKLLQDYKKQLTEEKKTALADIQQKLKNAEHQIQAEITALGSKSHILNQLAARLDNIYDGIQKTKEEFDKLLADLPEAQEEMVSEIDPQNHMSQAVQYTPNNPAPMDNCYLADTYSF